MTDRRLIARLCVFALAMTAAWTGLGFRLASLHLGPNQALRERVRRMHHVEKNILLVGRGRILDAKERNLALDLPVYHLCADPQDIMERGQLEVIVGCLARGLGMDRKQRQDRRAMPAKNAGVGKGSRDPISITCTRWDKKRAAVTPTPKPSSVSQ